MRNVFYLLLLLPVFHLRAQNEFLNKNNSLAPVGGINMGAPSSAPSVYTPNVFNKDKPTAAPKSTIPEKEVDMATQQFANPGDVYKDKLNKKLMAEGGANIDMSQFRRNIDLGEIKTQSEYLLVLYRDGGASVDGDEVKLLVNGTVEKSPMFLGYDYKQLRINLAKGFNKIDFEALNEGLYAPNTATFRIIDDKGNVIAANHWDLGTGFKASYMVIKE
ncbi:hypothetical protein [Flavobacterium caeni]|nr:hypothetical protein [Flavobacterium caeni]